MTAPDEQPVLIVGAGITGVTSALEAAEAGQSVLLVERDPSIGGRAVRNHRYFPKLCPPSCGMELNLARLQRNPRIRVLTSTSVTKARATKAGWSVTLAHLPAYVNDRCTACGECSAVCPVRVKDPFNYGMTDAPAVRLAHSGAYPNRFTLDRGVCPEGCARCVEACKYDAIDLDAGASEEEVEVGSVIAATGWKPYPLEQLPEYGGGELQDVVANVHLERMVSAQGPTGGKILRPSNGEPPRSVVFVQCAGSRDIHHLPYCSSVCCLVALKQARYVRDQLPDCQMKIFFIDRRAPGRNEELLARISQMDGVDLLKGKVARIEQGSAGQLNLRVEDTQSERLIEESADLVVLATGMVSCLTEDQLPFPIGKDQDGFGLDDRRAKLFVAGVARRPEDVAACSRDGTAAAAKAIVALARNH